VSLIAKCIFGDVFFLSAKPTARSTFLFLSLLIYYFPMTIIICNSTTNILTTNTNSKKKSEDCNKRVESSDG